MIVPVILSGGSGTRLWPLSRPHEPKQLIAMVDERTMLRATFDRLEGLPGIVDPWIVCNVEHRHLVGQELFAAGLKPDNVILEPVGRNTAPAAAAAAIVIAESDPDALMLLLPADHVIADEVAFHRAVTAAAVHSEGGKLATFGIVPTHPETGFGYIRSGHSIDDATAEVAGFVEKPDMATAEKYMSSGEYLWNSGMFLFAVGRYLEELGKFAPEIAATVRAAVARADRTHGIELDDEAFRSVPSDSIDFAVMEHTEDAVVVPLDAGWSDVGSWAALWEMAAPSETGNVMLGDVTAVDVTGSYLRSESRLVAAVGVENVVIVETSDAVLVAARDRSQDVKTVVELLREHNRSEVEYPRQRREPWGSTALLADTADFRLNVIKIDPGSGAVRFSGTEISRTWTLASGSGKVEFADESVDISTGAVLPAGTTATVRVSSRDPLQIVEIYHKL